MSTMPPSIQKLTTDALVQRMLGRGDLALPAQLGYFIVDKDRRVPVAPGKTPRLSIYALKQKTPQRLGNERAPSLVNRSLELETRVLLQGDDDDIDGFQQWITQCLATVGQLKSVDHPRGLVLSVTEGESATLLLEDSGGQAIAYMSRWVVEFTTLPSDLTATGRELT